MSVCTSLSVYKYIYYIMLGIVHTLHDIVVLPGIDKKKERKKSVKQELYKR